MGLVLNDKSIVFKESFDFDLLWNRLLVKFKKESDNVKLDHQNNITWDSTTLNSLRLVFTLCKLAGTKGTISIKRHVTGGWNIDIQADVTLYAIFSVIASIGGTLLTIEGGFATKLGMIIIAASVMTGLLGVNSVKRWIKKVIQKEVKLGRSENNTVDVR
jgi:hypothetical protein